MFSVPCGCSPRSDGPTIFRYICQVLVGRLLSQQNQHFVGEHNRASHNPASEMKQKERPESWCIIAGIDIAE
jgi:hypothetical protein